MGRKCYVPDCLSEEGREEDRGVTFHKIPLHSDIRPKWLSLCHVPSDKHNCKVIHVCSRHFLKVDFCNFKGKKYMLRQGVLPSVFPWSKLKKEPELTTIIKKESEVTTKPMQVEPEICPDIVMKTEIKEEPSDLILNADIKQESFHDDFAQCETSQPVVEKSSTTIEQKGKSIQTPSGLLNFSVNTRLEALDFNQMWFPAHIVEVDYEESEVLIHFEKYSSKYDEWISMNSSRLRPYQPVQQPQLPHTSYSATQLSQQSQTIQSHRDLPKKGLNKEAFVEGENVMASWSDARKFPAVIRKVLDHDTYEVRFVDGFMKILKGHRIMKTHGKIGCAPLFDPASGTKQDRRNKKRKLNVAQLFRKRLRADTSECLSPSPPSINMDVGSSNNSGEETEGWMPKWENGRPVGVESAIETHDGLKKSIMVPDPRLPPNWAKHVMQRSTGASAGKWDTIIVSPEGRRFRTRSEIKAFLEENPQLNYNEDMFTFSLYRRSRTRRVTHSVDVPQHTIVPPQKKRQAQDDSSNLKILLVDDAYKCPIAGCEKSFRRENLAQMHVKHYHPKFTKFLDSTPNVADLAYARTVGESLDKSPERLGKLTPGRPGRPLEKVATPKVTTPKPSISNEPEISQECLDAQASLLQKTKDSEILKLLNSKPSEESSTKFPPGLPSGMYPPIKLKDLLNKSEGIPKGEDLNLKSLSASTSRSTGIKTLLPVVRTNDGKRSEEKVLEEPLLKNSIKPILKQNLKRKRFISDNTDAPTPKMVETEMETPAPAVSEQLTLPENNQNYIVEGGEVIKIVRMKREEIINCTCGITEEDGLMIQCELCLCWQHAYCNNIERENQVPEKYICYICQNPMRPRSSRKYFHDQDWLKNGTLPVGSYHCKDEDVHKKRFELLKKSHDLSGLLVELSDYMHSVKVKLKIAQTKNHQKLYLWSKPWEKLPLPEKMELDQENEIPFSKSELDLFSNKIESHNDSSLLSLLKSPKTEQKIKEELSKLDLNTLIDNNFEQLATPIIPQPEAAINSIDCKLNLLDHIAHSQNLIEERLEMVQAQVDALDGGDNNNEEDFSHVSKTVQMLLKDLGTLQELSHSSSL
ncbi:hypothetical protein RI129_005294 [Pyrocoelia pectoralis]|uniref:PHD finger protein 20 n=1 Tax=Pyrocoelia pectoralis TaxID=417401 RepID=A0AAN7VEH8_9COLE